MYTTELLTRPKNTDTAVLTWAHLYDIDNKDRQQGFRAGYCCLVPRLFPPLPYMEKVCKHFEHSWTDKVHVNTTAIPSWFTGMACDSLFSWQAHFVLETNSGKRFRTCSNHCTTQGIRLVGELFRIPMYPISRP